MLGTFSVTWHGRTAEESFYRDTRSWQLMKYLAANRGREVPLEELTRVLWPSDIPGPNSVGTIRVRLRRLRERLNAIGLGSSREGLVLYGQDLLCLNEPGFEIETDLERIYGLCGKIEGGGRLGARRVVACRHALELFSGPYLAHSGDAAWVAHGREESCALFHRLASDALSLAGEEKAPELIQLLAAKALVMAPEDEELHDRIMSFLLSHGLMPEAVAHYARLSRIAESRRAAPPALTAFRGGPSR